MVYFTVGTRPDMSFRNTVLKPELFNLLTQATIELKHELIKHQNKPFVPVVGIIIKNQRIKKKTNDSTGDINSDSYSIGLRAADPPKVKVSVNLIGDLNEQLQMMRDQLRILTHNQEMVKDKVQIVGSKMLNLKKSAMDSKTLKNDLNIIMTEFNEDALKLSKVITMTPLTDEELILQSLLTKDNPGYNLWRKSMRIKNRGIRSIDSLAGIFKVSDEPMRFVPSEDQSNVIRPDDEIKPMKPTKVKDKMEEFSLTFDYNQFG